jgi:glycosyltransferase involved in cell wall biosynthesis
MLSFVVPAHNEQACLGRTVRAIYAAARATGRPYEVIVVDDASTDATAEVARKHDATVVSVNRRQIAATRNAGGRTARGERLFFVDADTVVSPRVVAAALRQLDRGAAGGGAPARFEGPVPLYAHLLMWWLGWLMRIAGMTGGAFMFMTREVGRAGQDRRPERGLCVTRLGRQCGRGLVLGRDVGLGAQRPAVLRPRRRPISVNRYWVGTDIRRRLSRFRCHACNANSDPNRDDPDPIRDEWTFRGQATAIHNS